MSSFAKLSEPHSRREAIRRASLFLGVAISPSLLAGALRAQLPSRTGPLENQRAYLAPEQIRIAGAVAERILPRTDTPGALDVGVPAFIDLMFGEFTTADDRKLLLDGLEELDASTLTATGRGFAELPSGQQDVRLKAVAHASQSVERTFFHVIKELTVLGYFTSETVGKTVLHYDPIPGRFDACIPLSQVGNVNWTR